MRLSPANLVVKWASEVGANDAREMSETNSTQCHLMSCTHRHDNVVLYNRGLTVATHIGGMPNMR